VINQLDIQLASMILSLKIRNRRVVFQKVSQRAKHG